MKIKIDWTDAFLFSVIIMRVYMCCTEGLYSHNNIYWIVFMTCFLIFGVYVKNKIQQNWD